MKTLIYLTIVGATLTLVSCGVTTSDHELLEQAQEDLENARARLLTLKPTDRESRQSYADVQHELDDARRRVAVLKKRESRALHREAAAKAARDKAEEDSLRRRNTSDDRPVMEKVKFWKKAPTPEPEPTFTDRVAFWRD
ncbi:MAG: hypothetical protein P1V20_21705 [Verrucomicrobiales bacterium]|nr:hypothetical protein [Verrucomicrobiales bacterium]